MKKVPTIKRILFNKRAFTIIELLVVIGIISILAVALLVTLNPTSTQKKARDSKRMKDATTLQAIIESYVGDGGSPICTAVTPCNSSGGSGNANNQSCAGGVNSPNWLDNTNLCDYAQSIPSDPLNQASLSCVYYDSTETDFAVSTGCDLYYYFSMSGIDYEIAIPQESLDNGEKLTNDAGTSAYFVEILSDPSNEIMTGTTVNAP
ncbi:MAG: type II secretion system protein [Patescibacteria group bacterium]